MSATGWTSLDGVDWDASWGGRAGRPGQAGWPSVASEEASSSFRLERNRLIDAVAGFDAELRKRPQLCRSVLGAQLTKGLSSRPMSHVAAGWKKVLDTATTHGGSVTVGASILDLGARCSQSPFPERRPFSSRSGICRSVMGLGVQGSIASYIRRRAGP